MNWKPIREAVRLACSEATGLAIEDVLLETERGTMNKSRGRRLRLDWEETDVGASDTIYVEDPNSNDLHEVIVTDEVIVVNARFFCDDHRTRADGTEN